MKNNTLTQLIDSQVETIQLSELIPKEELAHFSEMIDAYMTKRIGSQRHTPKTVLRDVNIVTDMVAYTGKAPWRWSEEDFEQWCEHLVRDRKLVMSSQRTYQSAIRRIMDYITKNVRFRSEIQQRYQIGIVQICTEDNCIPHVCESELSRERPAISHAEIDLILDSVDKEILRAKRFRSKDLYPLMRDKAMFYTMYVGGLRADETRKLDVGSFSENQMIPELGKFGFISVWGKGSNGSGPKHRSVPITILDFNPLMTWYLEEVRGKFLLKADPNEEALFLSERGKRLCYSSISERFKHLMDIAGLSDKGFTPHCVRHSSVTHESPRMSLEANRRKHGHVNASTTQGYNHMPDEYIEQEICDLIAKQIKKIKGE